MGRTSGETPNPTLGGAGGRSRGGGGGSSTGGNAGQPGEVVREANKANKK